MLPSDNFELSSTFLFTSTIIITRSGNPFVPSSIKVRLWSVVDVYQENSQLLPTITAIPVPVTGDHRPPTSHGCSMPAGCSRVVIDNTLLRSPHNPLS